MRYIERLCPAVTVVYFITASLLCSMCPDGIISAISLVLALSLCAFFGIAAKWLKLSLAIIVIGTAVNMLVSHNGSTVLFVLNDSPITLEALAYGAVMGCSIAAVLCWFAVFSIVMTGDRLLWVMGLVWPKLALVVSMALRSIPLYTRRIHEISDAQRAVGLYREQTLTDRIFGGARVFSALVTWALENGITTADSMSARGYGTGRRTSYALYRFRTGDWIFLALTVVLGCIAAAGMVTGAVGFEFYPVTEVPDGLNIFYAAYLLLAAMPAAAELWEELRWKYLRSAI